jgi:hypothetical protein
MEPTAKINALVSASKSPQGATFSLKSAFVFKGDFHANFFSTHYSSAFLSGCVCGIYGVRGKRCGREPLWRL